MQRLALIIAIACVITATGCAKKKEGPHPSVPLINTEDLERAKVLAKAASVTCGDGSCSPSVGLLSIAYLEGAGVCTASLVGDDLVVTNSHCIPDDLKNAGASCDGRLFLNFSADGYERQLECAQVLFASEINAQSTRPDYAFLRLKKRTNRPTLTLSRDAFHDQETVYLTKMNPDFSRNRLEGILRRDSCTAVQGSLMGDEFNSPYSDIIFLSGCHLIKGNSGSALVGGNGMVKGVAFASIDTDEKSSRQRTETIGRSFRLTDGHFAKSAFGTSFACVPDPVRGTAPLAGCSDTLRNSAPSKVVYLKSLAQQNNLNARMTNGTGARHVCWTLWTNLKDEEIQGTISVLSVPECLLASAPEGFAEATRMPVWEIDLGLDRFYRLRGETRKTGEREAQVSWVYLGGGMYRYTDTSLPDSIKVQTILRCQ